MTGDTDQGKLLMSWERRRKRGVVGSPMTACPVISLSPQKSEPPL